MIPAEHRINRLMADTGMGRVQAVRHLQQRTHLTRGLAREQREREGRRHVK